MAVRVEKIIAVVLAEAQERQTEEIMKRLSGTTHEYYESCSNQGR
jgi:hypothetical protein